MTNSRIDSVTRQLDGPQLVVRKERVANSTALVDARTLEVPCKTRKRVAKNGSVSRVHTVPSTLTQQMRAEIAAAVSYGRSIPQTAKEYNCVQVVVAEAWLRPELAKLRADVARLQSQIERLLLRRAA